jgi:hypothetical protein
LDEALHGFRKIIRKPQAEPIGREQKYEYLRRTVFAWVTVNCGLMRLIVRDPLHRFALLAPCNLSLDPDAGS